MSRPEPSYPPLPDPLPVPVPDNHTHLDDDNRRGLLSVDEHIDRAAAVGVTEILTIGCDEADARFTADIVQRHPQLLGGVAIHPNEAARLAERGAYDAGFATIADLARGERIVVVGETGLDYFRTPPQGRAAQVAAFRDHIQLAKELGKAMQIHDRDAHQDVLETLRRDGAPERTVFHCFSGDRDMAQYCVAHGWYLSLAGTVTFTNNAALREAVAAVGPARVMVETDAPYLTPHPWRGSLNAPYLIPVTVRALAQLFGLELPDMCSQLANNTHEVYGSW